MRCDPRRSSGAGALTLLLGAALFISGCGRGSEPALRSPARAGQPTQAASPAAPSAAVFKAEKAWVDAQGNHFTILASVYRPSAAGLNMCSMSTEFVGPSLVLSVRNDSRARTLKGPRISVNDRLIAFPHGLDGCSYVYAPSHLESFKPGESRTYRSMVMPASDRFGDVVLQVSVPARQKGRFVTKELMRLPAGKLMEAYLQGPLPGAQQPTGTTHHGG